MKILLSIIVSSILLISCKQNSSDSALKTYEAPKTHPYAESIHMDGYSVDGKKLLHQLYTKNKESEVLFANGFSQNERLERSQAKVYVISKEKDQVYYFPIGTSTKWIEENIEVFRYAHYKMYWINSELSLTTPSYLIISNERDVLINEQNFSIKELKLEKVSSIELKQVSKFQSIELEIQKFKVNPNLTTQTKNKITGRDCGDERPRACFCEYEINTYNNAYNVDDSKLVSDEEVHYKLFLNNEFVLDNVGRIYKKSFLPESDFTDFRLDFESDFYVSKLSEQRAKSSECKNLSNEKIEGIGKYLYDVKVIIRGVNETNIQLESL